MDSKKAAQLEGTALQNEIGLASLHIDPIRRTTAKAERIAVRPVAARYCGASPSAKRYPVQPIAILRGLAPSALGSVKVSRPSFISARILSRSIRLGDRLKLRR